MKTVDIKGKPYVEVNQRLKYFREKFGGYCLLSEIIELDHDRCIIKAKIINNEGTEVANGTAYEDANSTFINKTSYIENCETSAWGRCLANFGIGVDSSVASADEVLNAINNRSSKKPQNEIISKVKSQKDLWQICQDNKLEESEIIQIYKKSGGTINAFKKEVIKYVDELNSKGLF